MSVARTRMCYCYCWVRCCCSLPPHSSSDPFCILEARFHSDSEPIRPSEDMFREISGAHHVIDVMLFKWINSLSVQIRGRGWELWRKWWRKRSTQTIHLHVPEREKNWVRIESSSSRSLSSTLLPEVWMRCWVRECSSQPHCTHSSQYTCCRSEREHSHGESPTQGNNRESAKHICMYYVTYLDGSHDNIFTIEHSPSTKHEEFFYHQNSFECVENCLKNDWICWEASLDLWQEEDILLLLKKRIVVR